MEPGTSSLDRGLGGQQGIRGRRRHGETTSFARGTRCGRSATSTVPGEHKRATNEKRVPYDYVQDDSSAGTRGPLLKEETKEEASVPGEANEALASLGPRRERVRKALQCECWHHVGR